MLYKLNENLHDKLDILSVYKLLSVTSVCIKCLDILVEQNELTLNLF